MEGRLVRHNANMPVKMHRHHDVRVIVFLEGTVQETDLFGAHVYEQGDVLFRPPYYVHANETNVIPAAYLRLPVSNTAFIAFVKKYGWRRISGKLNLEDRVHRFLFHAPNGDELMELLLGGRLTLRPDVRFEHANDLRARVMSDAPIKAAASEIGKRPYQLTRDFLRQYGFTPTGFRREARLSRALRMLTATSARFACVAAECGFADQSHLSREIKRATGFAPGAFRTAMQS